MTGQPAMPNPRRLVSRSARIVKTVTGCSEEYAALTVYGIAVETMALCMRETGELPRWLSDLCDTAREMSSVDPLGSPAAAALRHAMTSNQALHAYDTATH